MRRINLLLIAGAVFALTGCATIDQAGSSLSCMLARATGQACGGQEGTVSSGQQAGRFEQLQSAFEEEIQGARAAQERAVQAMQGLSPKLRATAGDVQLLNVEITDSSTQQKRSMRTLDSVTIDMPLGGKGRDAYTRAMDEIKGLANTLADNRGSASIVVQQAAPDVKARRVNTASGETKSPGGQPIKVEKQMAQGLPAGVERYTVKAGPIRGNL